MKTKLTLLFFATTLSFTACNQDDTDDLIDDVVVTIDDFYGEFWVESSCFNGNGYTMSILETTDPNDAELKMSGLIPLSGWDGYYIRATVSGSTMTIQETEQRLNSCDGVPQGAGSLYTVHGGTGTLNGNTLTITYSFTYCDGEQTCSLTCTRIE